MFRSLFGKKKQDEAAEIAADEAFAQEKQRALERVLGPMDDTVLHAIIPFFLGGGLDLYSFGRCIPGVVFATQELIGPGRKARPKKGRAGYYELVACLPPGRERDDAEGVSLVQSVLNPIAAYSSEAVLNPGETAEIPTGEGDAARGVLFDLFDPKGVPFVVDGERFALLLVMPLHSAELAYARTKGSAALIQRLKTAGAYPYADLGRAPVV